MYWVASTYPYGSKDVRYTEMFKELSRSNGSVIMIRCKTTRIPNGKPWMYQWNLVGYGGVECYKVYPTNQWWNKGGEQVERVQLREDGQPNLATFTSKPPTNSRWESLEFKK